MSSGKKKQPRPGSRGSSTRVIDPHKPPHQYEDIQLLRFHLQAQEHELSDVRARLEGSVEEAIQLRDQIDTIKSDYDDVIATIKADKDHFETKAKQLDVQLKHAYATHAQQEQEDKEAHAADTQQLEFSLYQKDKEIAELRDSLRELKEYKTERGVLMEKTKSLEEEYEAYKRDNKVKFSDLEKQLYREKLRSNREIQVMKEQLDFNTEQRARAMAEETAKELIRRERHKVQEYELAMQREKQRHAMELEEKYRELETQEQAVISISTKKHMLSKKIVVLESELEKERQLLQSVLHKHEKERNRTITKQSKALEDMGLENKGLRKLVELKSRELKQIRVLAKEIVYRRGELEQYFLDAIEDVKDEMWRERDERARQPPPPIWPEFEGTSSRSGASRQMSMRPASSSPMRTSLPPATAPSGMQRRESPQPPTASTPPAPSPPKPTGRDTFSVRVNDMSWEEKERVLVTAFAKINGALSSQKPALWKQTATLDALSSPAPRRRRKGRSRTSSASPRRSQPSPSQSHPDPAAGTLSSPRLPSVSIDTDSHTIASLDPAGDSADRARSFLSSWKSESANNSVEAQ